MDDISTIFTEIKELLQDITNVTPDTTQDDNSSEEIGYRVIPLNPDLLAYCFDVILGFKVRYRIAEKVNYIIEFDYKGTYATVKHRKMSYRLSVDKKYTAEIIALLCKAKPLLEKLFILLGEKALIDNKFSMENEAPEYLSKLTFYQQRIESLETRRAIIERKCEGQYDISENVHGYKCMTPKGQAYLHSLSNEIEYDIEAYIDTFYSALEHVLTVLFPFTDNFSLVRSYYKDYIRNTRWAWDVKIKDVCGKIVSEELFNRLRRIKEVYRNHNAHGGFSREMMAFVNISNFGRYPLFVGKEYLKGFADGVPIDISYDMYMEAKAAFVEFWRILDECFQVPMMFIKSGLPIPVETELYTNDVQTAEHAQWIIDKTWFEIDNQSNMDW